MVVKDHNFLDGLFDNSLIKLRDVGFLLGDVCLQLLQKGATFRQNPIDGLDRDLLQQELVDRSVLTGHFCVGGFQAADAAPDDGLAAVVVPDEWLLPCRRSPDR